MAIFAISFRIGSEGNSGERYKSLVERIEHNTIGLNFDETTSFYVLECAKTTDDLRDDLYFNSDMSTKHDMLVVINLTIKEYRIAGTMLFDGPLERLMDKR